MESSTNQTTANKWLNVPIIATITRLLCRELTLQNEYLRQENKILKSKIKKERKAGKLILITSHILSDLEELTNRAIYIYEGEVFFSDTIEELKEITGESKFSPAIAKLMEWTLKKKTSKTQLSHV